MNIYNEQLRDAQNNQIKNTVSETLNLWEDEDKFKIAKILLRLRDKQLKTNPYKYRFLFKNLMVATN